MDVNEASSSLEMIQEPLNHFLDASLNAKDAYLVEQTKQSEEMKPLSDPILEPASSSLDPSTHGTQQLDSILMDKQPTEVDQSSEIKQNENSGIETTSPVLSLQARISSTLTSDDELEEDKIADFVELLKELDNFTVDEEYRLVAPLLLCSPEKLTKLVLEYDGLFYLNQWVLRSMNKQNISILKLLLKIVEKIIKNVPQSLTRILTSNLVDVLKTLRTYHDKDCNDKAANVIHTLKFLVADNNDPQLDPLRELFQNDRQKRSIDQISQLSPDSSFMIEDNEFEEPEKKRMKLFESDNTTILSSNGTSHSLETSLQHQNPSIQSPLKEEKTDTQNLASSSQVPPQASDTQQISSKTGKPKKKVTWVPDEAYQIEYFEKTLPVRTTSTSSLHGQGPQNEAANFVWKLVPLSFMDPPRLLLQTSIKKITENPTSAMLQENQREYHESMALYLNDSDIPSDPIMPPLADQGASNIDESKILQIPFSKRHVPVLQAPLPSLSHVQLPNPIAPVPAPLPQAQTFPPFSGSQNQPLLPQTQPIQPQPHVNHVHTHSYPNQYQQPNVGAFSQQANPQTSQLLQQLQQMGITDPSTIQTLLQSLQAQQKSQQPGPPATNQYFGSEAPVHGHHGQPPSYQHAQPINAAPSYLMNTRPPQEPYRPPEDYHLAQVVLTLDDVFETKFVLKRVSNVEDKNHHACKQFRAAGKCSFGNRCHYLHLKEHAKQSSSSYRGPYR